MFELGGGVVVVKRGHSRHGVGVERGVEVRVGVGVVGG